MTTIEADLMTEPSSNASTLAKPFVERIEAAHVAGVEAIMMLADTLIEARRVLKPRGLYYRIFSDAKDPLPDCSVSMSSSMADKITSIRERKALSDPSTWKGLPTSWTTLYSLTRLSVAEVRRLVGEGKITPDLSVNEARSLVRGLYPSDKPTAPKPTRSVPLGSTEGPAPKVQFTTAHTAGEPADLADIPATKVSTLGGQPTASVAKMKWLAKETLGTYGKGRRSLEACVDRLFPGLNLAVELLGQVLFDARLLDHPLFEPWAKRAVEDHARLGAILDLVQRDKCPDRHEMKAILEPEEISEDVPAGEA